MSTTLLDRIRTELTGEILTPDHTDFDRFRRIVTPLFDERPAVLVRASTTDDVVRAVSLASSTGLDLAVRSGGHSGAGHGSVADGIVLDVRPMRSLVIDPVARTAQVGPGLTAGEYTAAAAEHGLATGFGDTGTVGIGGIVTGGGIGLLSRKYGLTIDSLLAAEVVTADGRVLEVDADHHPDLFWAIRGGGGNFGVVTRFTLRLHPVDPFLGGLLILPATPETVAGFLRISATAPRELTTIANVMTCPPMPFVPADKHGSLVVMAMVAWVGDPDKGSEVVGELRALAEPIADMVQPSSYAAMFPPEEGDGEYHPTAVARNFYLDHVDEPLAATMLDRLASSDAPMRVVQLRALGGAIADVDPTATAYAHRRAPMMASVAAFFQGPADRAPKEEWVRELSARLDQGVPGAYVNFLGREGEQRVRDAYPDEVWGRLREIKSVYDPGNLFHVNQNIPPLDGKNV